MESPPGQLLSLFSLVFAALISFVLTWLLIPFLQRFALAKPNARSSHKVPTPQGAGIAVIAATLAVVAGLEFIYKLQFPAIAFGAVLFITAVGAADDIKSIPVLPRLMAQAAAVAAILLSWPTDLHIVAGCPLWLERGILLVAGIWFVNLVNFMDGLDWMTVAEAVPLTAGLVLLGFLGILPLTTAIVAAAVCGALVGFAPFNRPVAKVFLGDVGSLPIGLLLGWCLLELAYRGHLAAALLLPLYYLADATTTIVRRLLNGEKVWTAHRSHFYQRAADNGLPAINIAGMVFGVNIILAALATASATMASSLVTTVALIGGAAIVAIILLRFARQRR